MLPPNGVGGLAGGENFYTSHPSRQYLLALLFVTVVTGCDNYAPIFTAFSTSQPKLREFTTLRQFVRQQELVQQDPRQV